MNFVFDQGNLEFCSKSGKSQGNFYHFIRFSFKSIKRLNKKTENYAKHVMFSLQIAEFKVSEILLKVREKSGKFFNSNMWQP